MYREMSGDEAILYAIAAIALASAALMVVIPDETDASDIEEALFIPPMPAEPETIDVVIHINGMSIPAGRMQIFAGPIEPAFGSMIPGKDKQDAAVEPMILPSPAEIIDEIRESAEAEGIVIDDEEMVDRIVSGLVEGGINAESESSIRAGVSMAVFQSKMGTQSMLSCLMSAGIRKSDDDADIEDEDESDFAIVDAEEDDTPIQLYIGPVGDIRPGPEPQPPSCQPSVGVTACGCVS